MLLDHNGEEIKKALTEEEVMEKLSKIAPRTVEEQKLLVKKVAEIAEYHRKQRMDMGLQTGFGDTFLENKRERVESDGYTRDRGYRKLAEIPAEMAIVAEDVWGPEVWTDKSVFRKAFIEDETGRMCLTVDHKSI